MNWMNTIVIYIYFTGSGARYNYDRFPSNIRTEEQEEKRKQILAAASGALRFLENIFFLMYL